jgi:hypothetical protein
MSARTLSHSPTIVDLPGTFASRSSPPSGSREVGSSESPPGPLREPEPVPLLRSSGQYDDSCFEQTADFTSAFFHGPCDPSFDPPCREETSPQPPPLARSLSGLQPSRSIQHP